MCRRYRWYMPTFLSLYPVAVFVFGHPSSSAFHLLILFSFSCFFSLSFHICRSDLPVGGYRSVESNRDLLTR